MKKLSNERITKPFSPEPVSPHALERMRPTRMEYRGDTGVSAHLHPERLRPASTVDLDRDQLAPHLAAFHEFDSHASSRYTDLALSLMAVARERAYRCILIASALPGEGRTSVTLNLAASLARANQRVLVMDCDLARPQLGRMLGLEIPIGLPEVVANAVEPESALIRVLPSDFHLLGIPEQNWNSMEWLTTPGFEEVLRFFNRFYDIILFDSPPLLGRSDALLLKQLADATLLVIRQGQTRSDQLARSMALFNKSDLCGVVLNNIPKGHPAY
jgi:Mrp family chromosome partitioning ATPase